MCLCSCLWFFALMDCNSGQRACSMLSKHTSPKVACQKNDSIPLVVQRISQNALVLLPLVFRTHGLQFWTRGLLSFKENTSPKVACPKNDSIPPCNTNKFSKLACALAFGFSHSWIVILDMSLSCVALGGQP